MATIAVSQIAYESASRSSSSSGFVQRLFINTSDKIMTAMP